MPPGQEEEPVISVMSKQTAPASTWGDSCQGWTLVATDTHANPTAPAPSLWVSTRAWGLMS
jgi:hypothetical protein